ncbi:MAG: aminotransferase class I/II-fold pyridoxal phosphate-dependent enzyme [Thaumarchaeota archaeon]|nr:aminotransferase class I/II-fold pyridoxal phosphate-dependent enzyme [Nitrososphaerota archaeon]
MTKKIDRNESSIEKNSIRPHSIPIYQTSVYDYPDLESLDDFYEGRIPGAYLYSRNGLPNSTELGKKVAEYEKTDSGVVCSSGMGALLVAILSGLGKDDHVVASNDLYGGTLVLLKDELSRFGIRTTFADSADPENVRKSIERDTKLILVETISNPTMKICDIGKIAEICHESNAVLLVDNTFATPFVAKPAILGADIVMHSGTKYLGGHDDLTIGILCGKSKIMSRAAQFCTRSGVIAGPFDCWLATRSLSTWQVRVKQSSENAIKLANYLESRSGKVSKVYYPGLPSHPQHDLSKRVFNWGIYGGMLSFDLTGGLDSAGRFVKSLRTVTLTPSLGGVHTTISHPGKTSHRNLNEDQKRESGITDAMIRVSVGIETYDSVEAEFKTALDAA